MPRTYKRVVGKKSRVLIDADSLRKAIEDAKNGMTLRHAQQKHNVNYLSISRRINSPTMCPKVGIKHHCYPN